MRIIWNDANTSGVWLTPAIFGALLILIGILIYIKPELLAYFVAGVFVLTGITLIGLAWQTRARVTYRRMDE